MTYQQALKILMLSPMYFKLQTADRMRLIKEYCHLYGQVKKGKESKD